LNGEFIKEEYPLCQLEYKQKKVDKKRFLFQIAEQRFEIWFLSVLIVLLSPIM
jgi:hypothetical protein